MKSTALTIAVLIGISSSALSQASFTEVPGGASANDITPDGEIVVGNLNSGGGYYWRWKVDPAPIPIGGYNVVAVSDDGSVIVGNTKDPVTNFVNASRWTQATGWVVLPSFAGSCDFSVSSAYDVSGDGDVVVGLAWQACSGRGFRWTQSTGMFELMNLGNGQNRASAVAANGSRAVGFAQGSFNRTPAWWEDTGTGSALNLDDVGEYYGINDTGTIALGGRNGQAFYEFLGLSAPTPIGNLNPGWDGYASDMAEDLSRIVGYDVLGLGTEAWTWSAAGGIQRLQDQLTSLGVAGVPALGACLACTPNGRTIVGNTAFAPGWIVELPVTSSVTIYGCGVNPAGSMSVVSGAAELGQTLTLGVDNPLGSQPAGSIPLLFLATQSAPGYPCGTLLPGVGMAGGSGEVLISITPPNPLSLILSGPAWAGAGSPSPISLTFPNKPSLAGQRIYAQGALVDLTATTIPVAVTDAARIVIGG